MQFSKQTGGFYDPNIHAVVPSDAVEISQERYLELLAGQSNGLQITSNEEGYPILSEPPPMTSELVIENERSWRTLQLTTTDGIVSRHRDELEEGGATTLDLDEYAELQAYRRALRNWPESGEFPLAEHRPAAPGWLQV